MSHFKRQVDVSYLIRQFGTVRAEGKKGRKIEKLRFRRFELLKPRHTSMIRRQPTLKKILNEKKGELNRTQIIKVFPL